MSWTAHAVTRAGWTVETKKPPIREGNEREETTMVEETTLNQFLGKILGDLGGAFSVPMVRMGDKLGLYKALNGACGDRPTG
jgi:hypothetical protein